MTTPLELLAGDRDREKTADLLGQALTQGYLQLPDYEARLDAVFRTHPAGELQQVLTDLPVERIRRHDPRRRAARAAAARRGVRMHAGAYLAMAVVVLAVWAAIAATTAAAYFWPVWPLLGGAIGLAGHAVSVKSIAS